MAMGTQEHYEAFFRRFEGQITGYLWRMTCDEQTALDLSQETFFRAWEHFDTIREYPSPASWLFRVATNLALQHLRRRASPVGSASRLEGWDDPASSDPARRIVERELVRQTLLDLPAKQRAMMVLRDVYGLSFEEIGALLGMSADATKMALSRAREQFRQRYRRKDQGAP